VQAFNPDMYITTIRKQLCKQQVLIY